MKVKGLKFSCQLGLLAEDNFRSATTAPSCSGNKVLKKAFANLQTGYGSSRGRVSRALLKSNRPGCSGVRILINLLKKLVLPFHKNHEPLSPHYFY